MKTVYLFLATGFEEIEALTIVDMLRRAEIDITTVSISRNLQVEGAHGITVTADCTWVELSTEDADWLILPGGMPGTNRWFLYCNAKPLPTRTSLPFVPLRRFWVRQDCLTDIKLPVIPDLSNSSLAQL